MTTRYMLDTNVFMHMANKAAGHEKIIAKLFAVGGPKACALSAITHYEIQRKIVRGDGRKAARQELKDICSGFEVLPLNDAAAMAAAHIAAELESAGCKISTPDTLIAGHAVASGRVLVTDNTREFMRTGQAIENWRA